MKYKNFFEVGDKLEIKVIDGYIDINKNLISQLMEITSEDEYIVAMPIHKGKVINIPTSSKVSIIYSIKNKGIYCFDATVIYRNNENIAYIKIKQINETKKKQRRNYYRLPVSNKISVYYKENFFADGYTKDLSEGGLRFISDVKLDLNTVVICKMFIGDEELTIKSEVIRSNVYEKNLEQFEISLKFIELSKNIRDYIVAYIFKQQRILRQKGLI
ncbi:flagellar brake protein [Tepidibacter aestuarii]|uniref:flagellar brake protein n=1 Tax=Tepidibacter aestuarii TaxID=2925782 RepID=UPI0020BFC2D7|nr:PilZ domain-containing protein [Tepidibacter aestuarii]CAH2214003.1 C-di-GMP-binding flagellar brake protein YcgR, contains PilZNR and PilZ domains [Tepidibacter aestuarii]